MNVSRRDFCKAAAVVPFVGFRKQKIDECYDRSGKYQIIYFEPEITVEFPIDITNSSFSSLTMTMNDIMGIKRHIGSYCRPKIQWKLENVLDLLDIFPKFYDYRDIYLLQQGGKYGFIAFDVIRRTT